MSGPTTAQQRAADPGRSVWVTASAGTGKTRVLADRVLRLLLNGEAPERILCLTFTKAGAAEMLTRIQDDLARFAGLTAGPLQDELKDRLGRTPSERELMEAPALLPRVLDLPGGLQIMTIHSFCQSLLRRFPLEAGVVPHFDVLEPRDENELLNDALDRVLEDPSVDLGNALSTLAVLAGERGFREGLDALRQKSLPFQRALACFGGAEGLVGALAARLGVAPRDDLASLRRSACEQVFDSPGLAAACRALRDGSDANRRQAVLIGSWIEAEIQERLGQLDAYVGVFLTQSGAPRANLANKDVSKAAPAAVDALRAEQERLTAFAERCKAVEALARSRALIEVGAAVLQRYERQKRARAALTYDDLIGRTVDLLTRPGVEPWIRYKLDQRIDHLLVDEAQDTSPEQWAVIEALTDDFFSGEGAAASTRTLFVVGDEKQSIFSFQGADLATFEAVHERLRTRARQSGRRWSDLTLDRSFRSVEAILETVDLVFEDADAARGLTASGTPPRHVSARGRQPGRVELWPLIEVEPEPDPPAWELPDRPGPVVRAEQELARRIAGQIETWLREGTPVPSTGEAIGPGDVMILVRARNLVRDFTIRELKRRHIPVAGADRLRLTDELAVMDLMALGEALLLPEDDLTLASVLKSPIFGVDEDRLFALAHGRDGRRLVTRLRELAEGDPVLGGAWRLFDELRRGADRTPPFEFYARLLGEGGVRRRLLERLGPAAGELIEAFLAQALAYERAHPPSLQGFLHWLRQDTTELVRDPDRPRDEVRVLTVHGAKGLEAPVVILADAAFAQKGQERLLWLEDGLPLWRLRQESRDPVGDEADARVKEALAEEDRRLLYVAMTRARDWLVVAGWRRKQASRDGWHGLVEAGLARHGGTERIATADGPMLRLHDPDAQGALHLVAPAARPEEIGTPPHLLRPPPPEPAVRPPLRPSRTADTPVFEPPFDAAEHVGRRRGRIIHRLLQVLPDLDRDARPAAAIRLAADLARREGLPDHLADAVRQDALRLLDDPAFADLFRPGGRAEVPVIGTVAGQTVTGQIDRLIVGENDILVIDYKTDRSPPADPGSPPVAYLRQMSLYRTLLQGAFAGRRVACALLWTALPRLDRLDGARLDRAFGDQPCARRA